MTRHIGKPTSLRSALLLVEHGALLFLLYRLFFITPKSCHMDAESAQGGTGGTLVEVQRPQVPAVIAFFFMPVLNVTCQGLEVPLPPGRMPGRRCAVLLFCKQGGGPLEFSVSPRRHRGATAHYERCIAARGPGICTAASKTRKREQI